MPRRSSSTTTADPTTAEQSDLDEQGLERLPDFEQTPYQNGLAETAHGQAGVRPSERCGTPSGLGISCDLKDEHSGRHSWQPEGSDSGASNAVEQSELPGTPEPAKTDHDVPIESAFAGKDFLSAPGLKAIAERLIHEKDSLSTLRGLEVRYLWKRRGGSSGGNPKLGALQRPGGLLRYFSGGVPFVCWLAADNCRDAQLSPIQIEACIMHQLLHADTNPDDDDAYRIRGHSFEGFTEELDDYGPWSADLREVAAHIQPLPLDQALADADDGQESE